MSIGARIKSVRGDISQDDFAARLGVSKAAIGSYERNVSTPGSAFIISICEHFNVQHEWLLVGTGPMHRAVESQAAPALNQPPQAPHDAAEQCPSCPRCAKLEQRLEASEEERREITQENRKLWQEIASIREKLARMDEYQKMRKHMQEGTTDSYVA